MGALLLAPATIGRAQSDDGGATPAIVGGQEATPGEYPWQAFVEIGDDNIGYYMCGGSLIAPQWVLTAAHCVDLEVAEASAIVLPSQVTVYLGKHNMMISEPTEQIKRVARVIAYPNYNSNNSDGDLALLELTTPATLNSRVSVIPLLSSPADDALVNPGMMATVAGWGVTREGGQASPTLRKVSLPIVANTTCNQALPGPAITQNMLCAGYAQGGKDSCQGDSGGPLIVAAGAGVWKQAGIVSFGYGCAQPALYGVYTRVSRYTGWIGQYIGALAVDSFSPASGRAGTQVALVGSGFSSATAVDFAGTPASFTISSDAQLLATTPPGAVSGPITIKSAYGTAQTTASFEPLYQLNLQTLGNGVVDITPTSSRCTGAAPCALEVTGGVTAILAPAADPGFVFAGWRGACPALDIPCRLYMNMDRREIAVFAPPTSTLTITLSGGGSGAVVSSSGINCGAACSEQLPTRTALTLTAQPAAAMIFTGWRGDCTGFAPTCSVIMVGDQQVEAGFEGARYLHLPIIRR
jgi:secreted trypsin-like serine protease